MFFQLAINKLKYGRRKLIMTTKKPTKIEWMCTQCGKKETKGINNGRPLPGKCTRKNGKPHSWVQNRKI